MNQVTEQQMLEEILQYITELTEESQSDLLALLKRWEIYRKNHNTMPEGKAYAWFERHFKPVYK